MVRTRRLALLLASSTPRPLLVSRAPSRRSTGAPEHALTLCLTVHRPVTRWIRSVCPRRSLCSRGRHTQRSSDPRILLREPGPPLAVPLPFLIMNPLALAHSHSPPPPPLTQTQIRTFLRDGFLIVRNALDPKLLDEARDLLWAESQVPRLQRDDPTTWLQPFSAEEQSTVDQNQRSGRGWRLRSIAADDIVLDLLPRRMFHLAEQLCGKGTLIYPSGNTRPEFTFGHPGGNYAGKGTAGEACRGCYCILPQPLDVPRSNSAESAHVDGWAGDRWRVSCHAYLEDVLPGGGEFAIWPGSHRRLWHRHRGVSYARTLAGTRGEEFSESETDEYMAELNAIKRDTTPVAFAMAAGDCVFWHHRMLHWPVHNTGGTIRQALIYDYTKLPAACPDGDPGRHCQPREPNEGSIWSDWGEEVQILGGQYPALPLAAAGAPRL